MYVCMHPLAQEFLSFLGSALFSLGFSACIQEPVRSCPQGHGQVPRETRGGPPLF